MVVLVFKKCLNFYTTQSGNFKNYSRVFRDVDNESEYFWNSIWLTQYGKIKMEKSFNFYESYYTGAPVVGTPILGTHYIVRCDAKVCGAERESSRTIQGRMHWAVYFALLCFASGATHG